MFTGLVQGLGEIARITRSGEERRFAIRPLFRMDDLRDGESIAVNGACLSVEEHGGDFFIAYASAETLARTNLRGLAQRGKVNLERALAFGERLGGHLVSGHVDCLATVRLMEMAGQSMRCVLEFPSQYGAEVIAKGSVALNGISLTVNECGPDFLEVNVIPDSQKRTNFSDWRKGSQINMETDLIGKYVRSFLGAWRPEMKAASGVSLDMLARNGFI